MSGRKHLAALTLRFDGDFDPRQPTPMDGWSVDMPIGSEVVSAGIGQDGGCLYVLMPVGALRVKHPFVIIPIGSAFEPKLGRRVGRCFGCIGLPGGTVFVFEDAPWPTRTIDAVKTLGAA